MLFSDYIFQLGVFIVFSSLHDQRFVSSPSRLTAPTQPALRWLAWRCRWWKWTKTATLTWPTCGTWWEQDALLCPYIPLSLSLCLSPSLSFEGNLTSQKEAVFFFFLSPHFPHWSVQSENVPTRCYLWGLSRLSWLDLLTFQEKTWNGMFFTDVEMWGALL